MFGTISPQMRVDLPGPGRLLGGWHVSAVADAHSGLPFTPVLDFDNAELQSLVIPERPNVIGNPDAGVCPNGAAVGTVSCWFNPRAFAVPPAGRFGNAGRNILRGRRLRSSMHRCTKTFGSRNDGRLRLEWKLITSSTIRILAFRATHKARLPLEATGMPSSRMRRVISPLTQARS